MPNRIKHAEYIDRTPRADGDIDAVVVRITDTGSKAARCPDRYRHVIQHNLGRAPVGVQIIKASGPTEMYVISEDSTSVTVRFTEERVDVNVRIW